MRFSFVTKASPDQVRRALTDFTERRLEVWDRTLDPRTYELRDIGDTWAIARESTPGSPFWVVCRYDWSDPEVVRWTITDSSYGGGGQGVVRTTPLADGRTRVHADWHHAGARSQKPLLFLMRHSPLHLLVSRLWVATLDRYADDDAP